MELVPEGGMRRRVTDLTSRLLMLLPVLQIPCTAPAYLKLMSCGSGPDQALMNS